MTHSHKIHHAHYAVVGSGIAGLRAAIELSEAGSVLVLAKSNLSDSATAWAQGGIAVALSDEDEIGLHEQDTINAGDGLCRAEAVALLVEEGPKYITQLIEWGTEFDRAGTKLAFTREAAHSRSRILHAHGDSTGREISRALLSTRLANARGQEPIDIATAHGRVVIGIEQFLGFVERERRPKKNRDWFVRLHRASMGELELVHLLMHTHLFA